VQEWGQKLTQAWRYMLKRLNAWWVFRRCDAVGRGARLRGKPHIERNGGRICLGQDVCIYSYLATVELYAGPGAELVLEDGVFVNNGVILSASQAIRVGARSMIGPHCVLMDNDFHGVEPQERHAGGVCASITLEEDVWLGTRAIILKGVRIGRGSVVAAGSVVTKDVPAGVLVAGIPARVVRSLTPSVS
jgi:acetyltransferase-like isoleucine patch superfamily enzyme